MNRPKLSALAVALLALLALAALPAGAARQQGFGLELLVDGAPLPEIHGRGAVYVEALPGREYALRLTNPLPRRVAVALAVDGLNTIDARHSDARSARKWVLPPYGTVQIDGWQVSGHEAGFFVEKELPPPARVDDGIARREKSGAAAPLRAAPGPAAAAESSSLSDEHAATGIGRETEHRVRRVRLDLEERPAAVVRLRYEYRPQLVELGLLPAARPRPLDRRERARGFAGGWCPTPR
ncbi:MAG: hypothetical protein KJ058_17355 [Thermoanaerobaculia bacterium]|nr:hypothetical protein [Thermoanaerobaculia bacterium]